ncbi:hypothetical protein DY000_02046321 [Brassica cretica]|uniref:Uncharacterized protein n=1 Tax=Brassica cretica TaxID=69181 RepID=A0ABQ7EUQ3_BRACR|nr:hypothetical protein DY000_02046321 [Brassica cretica]
MVATLILVRDDKGDLYAHEGHLRNPVVQRIGAQEADLCEYYGMMDKAGFVLILFSLSKVFHFPEEGGNPEIEPKKLPSGEPGFLPVGILGTGVPSSGDSEAGVLPRVWKILIPEYFSPTGGDLAEPPGPGQPRYLKVSL